MSGISFLLSQLFVLKTITDCQVQEDADIIQTMNLENNENNSASRSHITLTFLGGH